MILSNKYKKWVTDFQRVYFIWKLIRLPSGSLFKFLTIFQKQMCKYIWRFIQEKFSFELYFWE